MAATANDALDLHFLPIKQVEKLPQWPYLWAFMTVSDHHRSPLTFIISQILKASDLRPHCTDLSPVSKLTS